MYRDQGVSIHDKHIELIVRQMLRRVLVAEQGESPFLPGERVDSRIYAEVNRQLVHRGQAPGRGPSRADGDHQGVAGHRLWLSAASFQETTRVLTEAAIEGKSDQLFGLKENIIIGKLIPAGTGMTRYRDMIMEAPDAETMPFWSSDEDTAPEDLAAWLASIGNGAAANRHRRGHRARRQWLGWRRLVPGAGRRRRGLVGGRGSSAGPPPPCPRTVSPPSRPAVSWWSGRKAI